MFGWIILSFNAWNDLPFLLVETLHDHGPGIPTCEPASPETSEVTEDQNFQPPKDATWRVTLNSLKSKKREDFLFRLLSKDLLPKVLPSFFPLRLRNSAKDNRFHGFSGLQNSNMAGAFLT
uniref:Uncharacterized protein n=1 Tax=Coccidioides posadasii RMSCC 3488 TaxID=454284 RepID=A0A0J6FGH8_COCPO|nr:hypothetical protein CPAG_08527 [Coccidioides posadasii RMSCC 3488]